MVADSGLVAAVLVGVHGLFRRLFGVVLCVGGVVVRFGRGCLVCPALLCFPACSPVVGLLCFL